MFDAEAERAFVDRVLQRDDHILDHFTQRIACVPRLLAIRNRRMGSPLREEELQDLAQDAFVVILRRLRDYRPIAPLESWIHGICCLLLKDAVRSKARQRRSAPESEAQAVDAPKNQAMDAEIEGLLVGLAPMEADVLRLKHLEGLTFVEVARRLHISPNTAKTLHYRGLVRLRSRHAGDGNEELR